MKPYLLVSDLHCHAWSQYARPDEDGVNSRLRIILDELNRAALALQAAGGNLIVMAGDLFHVRGSIDPEVFNPVHQAVVALLAQGFEMLAIPGNHDLKSKETTQLGNAMQTLGALPGFGVVTAPYAVDFGGQLLAFIPWCASYADLRDKALALVEDMGAEGRDPGEYDLIIHAGINGVLMGMPDHGIDAAEVASWGFRRVFAGHYHHHKVLEGGKVISIGATTHQTWSDVGANAGFLIVDDAICYQASHAPRFVEITSETDPDDVAIIAQGNYVRVRDFKLTDAEVQLLRKSLIADGAEGVSFQVARETVSARGGGAPTKAASLEASVDSFVDKKCAAEEPDLIAAVKAHCADIMSKARSITV